jgi:hypothetical protein
MGKRSQILNIFTETYIRRSGTMARQSWLCLKWFEERCSQVLRGGTSKQGVIDFRLPATTLPNLKTPVRLTSFQGIIQIFKSKI